MSDGHFISRKLRPNLGSAERDPTDRSLPLEQRATEVIDAADRARLGLVGPLDPLAKYRPHDEVAATIVDGEAVLVQLETGRSYSLNAPGTRIWGQLQAGRVAAEILDDLCAHYEVDRARAERELSLILAGLLEALLLRRIA